MASVTRLKRLVMTVSALRDRAAAAPDAPGTERTLGYRERLDQAVSDDLNTPRALPVLDEVLADKKLSPAERLAALTDFDAVPGLDLATIPREALRVRPKAATITPAAHADRLPERPGARAATAFRSEASRVRQE